MARSWSERARRDFREREEYRKRNNEKDRYEKRDDDRDDRDSDRRESAREREEGARRDRREERGFEDDYENDLMQIRNASPDDDVDDVLERLRSRYDYYERELDKYDADYDDLMAKYDLLRRDNQRYMMREGREIERQQDKDIKQDGEIKDFDDLFKEREG